MPDRLSLHAPTLFNTIGHAAGAIIFGILLYLLFVDWRRNPSGKPVLPCVAAALALLWNLGSMVGLATDARDGFTADFIVAASFSVLSFLPAVLLHISAPDSKWLVLCGYVLSFFAAVLHFEDLLTGSAGYHYAAVLLITIGFGVLTAAIVVLHSIRRSRNDAIRRLVGAMSLFLFVISFMHFSSNHGGRVWSGELALHHIGIPLALFVLLHDYRFLLLDTFIRFLVNACLAAAAVALLVVFGTRFDPLREIHSRPFAAGLAFVAACVLLILFGSVRRRVQALITRSLFMRSNPETLALKIQEIAARQPSEQCFLNDSSVLLSAFFGCEACAWSSTADPCPAWAQIAVPVAFAQGDSRLLLLGPRRGGRVFLSEDVAALQRLLVEVARQIDRLRAVEMRALLARGELQALQAQINPHFLFNTLNTIYGCVPRASALARELILNLSDILRYSLSNERAFIRLDEEVKIVRAYLEIEQARLGARLHTEIAMDAAASEIEIPAFSIQPLVENAVKYGAAARPGAGYVRLTITLDGERVQISISNSGAFPYVLPDDPQPTGNGVALKNVRRRLAICYGDAADFRIESDPEGTVIRFDVPARALQLA